MDRNRDSLFIQNVCRHACVYILLTPPNLSIFAMTPPGLSKELVAKGGFSGMFPWVTGLELALIIWWNAVVLLYFT